MTAEPGADVDGRVTHHRATGDGVALHLVAAGPEDGPPVVLLHGFPECWYTWRRQIGPLADAGYRVLAPDLRGYNRSAAPRGIEPYRLDRLAGDVAALLDGRPAVGDGGADGACAEGGDRVARPARLVGHDWGGVVAWKTAMTRPDVVDRLVALNAPHPVEFVRELSLEQALRSWYGLFFGLPGVPEALLRAGDFRLLDRLYRTAPARPGAITDEDVRRFKRALGRPGSLTAALNYYRAFLGGPVREHLPGAVPVVGSRSVDPASRVEVPTLVLWGERDPALSVERTRGLERYAPGVRVERFPAASHWVHVDRSTRVTEALLAFLG